MTQLWHHLKTIFKPTKTNHKGFTIIETVAAITIISLVLVSAFAIAINTRVQLLAQERRVTAQQEITTVRSEIMARMDANHVGQFLNARGNEFSITQGNCSTMTLTPTGPNLCSVFLEEFEHEHAMSVLFRLEIGTVSMIRITVSANFHGDRHTEVEGVVFASGTFSQVDLNDFEPWDLSSLQTSDFVQGFVVKWPDSSGNDALWVQRIENSGWAQSEEPGSAVNSWGAWNRVSNPNLLSPGQFNVLGDLWYHTNVYENGDIVFHNGSYWIVNNNGEANSHEPGTGNLNNIERNRDGWNKISDMNHPEILAGAFLIQGDPWIETNTYTANDVVLHNGSYWVVSNFGEANSNEPGEGPGWQPTTFDGSNTPDPSDTSSPTIPQWNAFTTYAIGDIVAHNGTFWIARVGWASSQEPQSQTWSAWNEISDPNNVVGFNVPNAEWIPTNVYETNDTVTFGGNTFRARQRVSGPSPNETWAWQQLP